MQDLKKREIKIGDRIIGDGHPVFIVAEIGINHNGDVNAAKGLIDVAHEAGCDAVKFQKRNPEVCVPPEQRGVMRETPWGYITYIDYRYKVEFGQAEYSEIDRYCKDRGIMWFASCWDKDSVDFMGKFNSPCYKIASASLNDDNLLKHVRSRGKPVILSTGMSTQEEVDRAVSVLGKENLILMHCVSTYPADEAELNLSVIPSFRERYGVPVGYSGHERGVVPTVTAVALGACAIERHITTDRTLWGSDHSASLEPKGLKMLVKETRIFEKARGDGIKRLLPSEAPIAKKLRREIRLV